MNDDSVMTENWKVELTIKQARKGFRPPGAMKGIGYFQNEKLFRNFLGNVWRIFWGGIFWEDFFGRIGWEEFFVYIVKVS